MIPRSKVQNVEDHLGDGESQAFTIAVTGKAFHVLIDGLYSNKIQSIVRELWSNARDSHVEAGKPDVPFVCDLPTNLSPVFRVRDYGTGLEHDDVMHLYTTMFGSSKTGSNTSVGMLGLGSKSPFAYTDSFSVVAYDGKQKRTYVAYIQTDGVPNIRHVSTNPSAELKGLEVSFAVKIQDYREFAESAQAIGYGFDVLPKCSGAELQSYKNFLRLGNVRIVENSKHNYYGCDVKIKQGCVLYPVDIPSIRNAVKGGKMVIIEVPIGSVDVTASREALSLDDETKAVVAKVTADAQKKIEKYIEKELAAETGQYEKVVKAIELSEWCNLVDRELTVHHLIPTNMRKPLLRRNKRGSQTSISRRTRKQREEYCLWRYHNRREWDLITSLDHYTVSQMEILIDDKEKVQRKASRIRDYVGSYSYVISGKFGDVEKQKARLKRLLHLKDEQFIRIEDLPDNPPLRKVRQKKEGLKPGEYWVLRSRGRIALPDVLASNNYYSWNEVPNWKLSMFDRVGLPSPFGDDPKVKFFTEKEAIRLGLDDKDRLDIVCAEKIKTHKFNFKGYALNAALRGKTTDIGYKLIWAEYFPDIPIMTIYDELTERYGKITGQLDTERANMEREVRKLERKLPLLFHGKNNEQAISDYIKLKEAKS